MSDLRAAAERWRLHMDRPDEARSPYYAGTFNQNDHAQMQLARDLRLFADAYVAEHPADDDEQITEEWIVSAGFVKDRIDPVYIRCCEDGIYCLAWHLTDGWILEYDMTLAKQPKTRGDVRRLCRALGIELKETPDGPAESERDAS